MRLTLLSVLAVLCSQTALAGDPDALQRFDSNIQRGHQVYPGELAVRLAPGVRMEDLHGIDPRCVPDHQWGHRPWVSLDCDPALSPRELVLRWSDVDAVTRVQAPFAGTLTETPDDLTSAQWHLFNGGQTVQGRAGTRGADIGAPDAWDITTGSDQVIVAVIDTGVWVDHNELSGQIHQAPGEICDNEIDDDGNGYVDDCSGWDMGDGDNDPDPRALPETSSSGRRCVPVHGTFISGLIAPATDNGKGISGVLWDGRILPIKMVSDDDCRLTDTMIAEGVYYAVDQGASVINASWTIGDLTTPALNEAMTATAASDTLLVIAAGNANQDLDTQLTYPVDYKVADDLVVAATDNRDNRSSFSNWGELDVDIAAPGQNLRSLGIGGADQQIWSQGTSFAAPLVAAGAALIWDQYPELRRSEVRASLIDGAEPKSNLDCANVTKCVASGARLDLPGALDEAEYWATTPFPSVSYRISDSGDGDGDGVVERGEQPLLVLLLSNSGHAPTGRLRHTLSIAHPHLTATAETLESPGAKARSSGVDTGISFALDVPLDCATDGEASVRIDMQDLDTGEVWIGESTQLAVLCDIDEDEDGVRYPEDCDDDDPDVRPGADESCNEIDDDCDGDIDEDDAVDAREWYPDADGDGYGVEGTTARACAPPDGFGAGTDDCDDGDPTSFPGGEEVCDEADNDCNGLIDDEASDAAVFYADRDGDGWGADEVLACEQGELAARTGDCDDEDAEAYPDSRTRNTDCSEKRLFLGCACNGSGGPGGGLAFALAMLALLRRRR